MTAPGGGGFEVLGSAVENAATPMADAYDALERFGDEMRAAATLAGEGATVDAYRSHESDAAGGLRNVPFGHTTG